MSNDKPEEQDTRNNPSPKVDKPEEPSPTGTPERFFDHVEPLRGERDLSILNEKKDS